MKKGLIILFTLIVCKSFATNYTFSPADTATINLTTFLAGDNITLTNGTWDRVHLFFQGNGAVGDSILIHAATPGGVNFTGGSWIDIRGTYMKLYNIKFVGRFDNTVNQELDTAVGNSIITLGSKSAHCRLTNIAFVNYNYQVLQTKSLTWLTIQGNYHLLDHCTFDNMTQGRGVKVPTPSQFIEIRNNYFGLKPDIGGNGGEWLRLGGTVKDAFWEQFCYVHDNHFEHFGGEQELISIKTSRNNLEHNTFYHCQFVPLSFRQGQFDTAQYNFIFADTAFGGAFKVYGNDHLIRNNYVEGTQGVNLYAAFVAMEGAPDPYGSKTTLQQGRNVIVDSNLFVNCVQYNLIGYDYGGNNNRFLSPVNFTFQYNLYQGNTSGMQWDSIIQKYDPDLTSFVSNKLYFNYLRNYVDPAIPLRSGSPAVRTNPQLVQDGNGIYRLSDNSPVHWSSSTYIGAQGANDFKRKPIPVNQTGVSYTP